MTANDEIENPTNCVANSEAVQSGWVCDKGPARLTKVDDPPQACLNFHEVLDMSPSLVLIRLQIEDQLLLPASIVVVEDPENTIPRLFHSVRVIWDWWVLDEFCLFLWKLLHSLVSALPHQCSPLCRLLRLLLSNYHHLNVVLYRLDCRPNLGDGGIAGRRDCQIYSIR